MQSHLLGDCEWETRGLLFVYHKMKSFDDFSKTNELLSNEFGLPARRLDSSELIELEPALKPVVAGGWLYEGDAHLRPHLLMDSWKALMQKQDIPIYENCEFLDFDVSGKGVEAVQTTQGRIEADQVVFATGSWSRHMQSKLRTRIPVEPGKGYSITMPRPNRCPKFPMLFEDHKVGVTPTEGAYRLGSTMEFAGFDQTLREDRLTLLSETAKLYLHDPMTDPVLERWYGWRPMSCDEVPLIGRVPRFNNVWMAAGHGMLGLSMATATGKLISEMLTNDVPHIDPTPYRLDRF